MENENMVGAVSASEAQESVSGTAAVGTDAGIDTNDAGLAEDGTSAEASGRDFTDHEGEDTGAGAREEDTGAGEGEDKPIKGEQSTDERRENARKRREREEQAKLDAARKEARAAAIIEVLGGVNPYTKAPMKDAHDVAAYERMKKIEASGGNPTEDYAAAMAEDAREAEAKEAKAAQDRRWYADDRNAFEKAYPDVKLDALLVDPDFIDYPSKGYFYYGNGDSPAHMVIHADCPPPLEGRDNITVTFSHAGSDQSWRIDMCKFGAMFGGGGNADRIVVAGLYGEEHIEYWSYWRDPTYFPDNGYNAVGSEGSAIVGFSRISDGVLACFKEEGRGEPVIYYHTAEDEPIYNDDGKLESMRFKLYTDAGNAGEGMISRMSSVDFYGDPLILSRNGVFGISYKQNVETADRYAAERSRNIRTNLCKRDLSNACGVVFEGKYWLAVDGVCYVADAGYTFRPSEGTSGYQYEWWLLDNIPATVMCVADGRLYFGTADGRLCYFLPESESDGSADAYRDLCWEVLTSDMITEQEDDFSELVVADDVYKTLRIGDRLVIQQSVWAVCLAAGDYELYDGKILPREGVAPMRQGDVLFISGDSSGAVRDGFYTVADVDDIGAFQLADTEGTVVTPAEAGFTVGISVTGKELYIVEMKADETDGVGGTVRVSLCEGGDPITFIEHELTGELDSWSGRIIHADTVVAEWYTPVLDLGTNTAMKTLTRLTVATEPGVSGRVTFGYETGYETRVASKMVASALGMGGLDLTSLDFHEFSLSSFASSWTQRVNERNINYIAFRWLSDDPSGSRVDSITARYKVTGNIRGGL